MDGAASGTEGVLDALLGAIEAGVCVLDAHGRVWKANEAWLAMTALSREAAFGRDIWELFPQTPRELRALHDDVRAGKTVVVPDHPDRRAGRETTWYSGRLAPIPMPDGVGILITAVDVTERRRAEHAHHESEERFRLMADSAPVLIWVTDRDGGNQFVNRTYREYFHVSIEEVEGNRWRPLIHPDDRATYISDFLKAIAERTRFVGEMRVKRDGDDGDWRWLASVAEPRLAPSGELLGTIGMSTDITERKRVEEAIRATRDQLAESNERFRDLAETIREVFWLADPTTGALLYASPAYELIWGRTVESLHASPQDWVEAVHPDDRERVRHAALTKQIVGRFDEEYRILRPDGEMRWIRDRAFPVRNAAGDVIRMAGVAEDVSERRSLEAQFRQSQKMEAVGRLAGGIAHDFNNLLSIILSYASLALGSLNARDPLREYIQEIEAAGGRASELTTQLLAFSRQHIVQPKVIDLNQSVSSMERMLPRLLGEDVELQTQLDAAPCTVLADRGQIEQIVMNLVVNARDAMPKGGKLTIATSNVELDESYTRKHLGATPGRYAVLAVTDTGTGMDKATQANIFEPFFTTKEVGKGTGLGLSTVFGIVQQSGGSIDVTSELGVGTTFKVYLPSSEEKLGAATAQPTAAPGGREDETILLVEDDEQVRQLAQSLLGRWGYTVLTAASPAEAIALSDRHEGEIKLLLTDVVMPGMNGRELAEHVRANRADMQVLYMSGYTANVVLERGISDDGASAFMQKPLTPELLSRAVRQSLDAFRPGRAAKRAARRAPPE